MNLLDLLFPKKCVDCQNIGSYFCPNCILKIKQTDLICPFCERTSIGGLTHPICIRKYGLDGFWFLGVYEGGLKKAIQKLKYRFVKDIAESLVDLTIDYWARFTPQLLNTIKKDHGNSWLITPVPLHKARQNWRGFNQSAEIGKIFAQKLGLNYEEVLKRVRNTKPQVTLSAQDRKKNIKNAFSLTKRSTLNVNILLIDDVWTTGSTLKECGFVLKRGGAKSVWALTLAR